MTRRGLFWLVGIDTGLWLMIAGLLWLALGTLPNA